MSQTESKDNIIIHENEGVPLKRRLGFVSGVALIVGTIIGSGIFVSPKGVLTNTGSVGLCLIVWCICGVVSLAAALVYAELGTLIPLSGSDFSYMLKAFGSFPAFMYTWTQLFIYPGAQVIKGLTVAQYLGKAVFDDCGPTDATLKLIAAVVVLTSGITNCISVRLAASVQIIFTILKLIGLATIIGGGILMLSRGTVGSLPTGLEGSVDNPTSIATAIYSGLWAFGGWNQLNFVTEELKNPRRNLPLCIITSVLLVLVVYLMVNVSYFTVLTKEEFVSSWAVAATWAEYVLPGAVVIIPITVACSVYGSMNGSGLIVGRILFATARVQLFPECLSYLNVNTNIPVPSTMLISILAFALIMPSDIRSLLNMLEFLKWFFYGLGMIAHIVLRYRMKDVDRPLKVPIVVSVVVLAFSIYLVVAPFLEPVKIEFWYAVGFLVLGAILYVPFAFFKLGLPGMDYINTFVQMMTQSAPPQEIAI
ncbi:solute carrier family 7 (L-type amino acid transporter), member 9 [Mytilus galloprovincialis]|nr:solute carrier family 7 (L-type amino acid transporter), member 9 [Mytilus galloprovincialis]